MHLTDELTDADRAHLTEAEIAAIEGREDLDPTFLEEVAASDDAHVEGNPTLESEDESEPAAAPSAVALFRQVDPGRLQAIDAELSNLTSQKESLASEAKQLRERWELGEIDSDDYHTGQDNLDEQRLALLEQRSDLKNERSRIEERIEANNDAAQQAWQAEQQHFFKNPKNAEFTKHPVLYGALDAEVKRLARDPGNATRSPRWVLETAAENVRALQAHERAEERDRTPQAGRQTAERDLFAKLDALEGQDFEDALASLDPETAARYAAL